MFGGFRCRICCGSGLLGFKLGVLLSQRYPSPERISRLTANAVDDRVRAAAISHDGDISHTPMKPVFICGGGEKWLSIQSCPGIASLNWAADSKSLWAASAGEEENALLNIDLQGHAHAVWRPKKLQVGWAIPSRDGRYVALHVGSKDCVLQGSRNRW
jgi:hypothetical protein